MYLINSEGYRERLTEKDNGEYWSSQNGFKGTVGNYYSLYIKLDNKIYESEKQLLSEPVYSDSIYAEHGSYEYSVTSSSGQVSLKTIEGIYVYVDINMKGEEPAFFLFNKKVIWQNTRILSPPIGMPVNLYFRQILFVDNLPDVKVTLYYKGEQIIKKHLLYFLPYKIDYSNGIESEYLGP